MDIFLCLKKYFLIEFHCLSDMNSSYLILWKGKPPWMYKFVNSLNQMDCLQVRWKMTAYVQVQLQTVQYQVAWPAISDEVCLFQQETLLNVLFHNSCCNSVTVASNFIIRITLTKPVTSCEYSFCSPSYKQINCDLLVFTISITTIKLIIIYSKRACFYCPAYGTSCPVRLHHMAGDANLHAFSIRWVSNLKEWMFCDFCTTVLN